MRHLYFPKILVFLSAISGSYNVIAADVKIAELPIPDESHAALTVERGLYGVYTQQDHLILFPGKSQHMVRVPLKIGAASREAKFGKMTDQTRVPLSGAQYPGDWRGAISSGDRLLIWDASMLQLMVLRSKDDKFVYSSTVPTDTLKPAADRSGEPTSVETAKARDRFRAASRKIFGTRFTGLSEIPDAWEKGDESHYLITSRIPGYSLVIMGCKKNDPAACAVRRQCFVEGKHQIVPSAVAGVGVVAESRQIVIGDSERNEINIYKFNSCFDVVWQRTVKVPSRLPKLTNLTVDKDGRLWMVTAVPDSFTDSNLFYWDKDVWLR